MKKTTAFLFTSILIYFLTACGPNSNDKSDNSSTGIKGKPIISEVKEYKDSVNFAKIQQAIDFEEQRQHHGLVQNIDFPTNQDLVGYGFNSSTLQPSGKVVENDNNLFDTSNFSSGGQEVTKILERITTKSELYNKLGIDIKASVKYGAYKGSASLQMIDESSINSYSDYLFLKVTVTNAPLILKESKLTRNAKINSSNKKTFFERYGNEYFYGKVTGGEFCCLFEFSSNNSSSKKSIKAGIDFAVKTMFASGNFSMAMEHLTNSLDEKTTTKIKLYRLGDEGNLAKDNIDSLVNYANEFPDKVKNNGGKSVVLRLLSKPVLFIDDLPTTFKANDFLIFNKQNYYLDSIAKEISKVQDIDANYNYAIDNSNRDYFSSSAIDSANKFLDSNNKSIDKMKRLFFNCITSIQDCSTGNSNRITYETYIPKSSMEEPTTPTVESKNKVLTNDELLITEVPFGVTKTIEFRGNWKINKTDLQTDRDEFSKFRNCGSPSPLYYHILRHPSVAINSDPRDDDIRLAIPLQSRIRIQQKNISTGQVIDETLWDGLKPFTTRTGVKVYVRPEYAITQCEPPVTAYIY